MYLVLRLFPFLSKASNSFTGLESPWGFQEVEDPRFNESQHTKVVRFRPYMTAAFNRRKYPRDLFLFDAESTPGR
jgi:hypothetical protein